MYEPIDAGTLRAPAFPSGWTVPPTPDPTDTDARRAWIAALWANDWFRDAVELASPDLANRIDYIDSDSAASARVIERGADALLKYALRATSRPTPFGVFAGVAAARFGPRFAWQFGDDHQPHTRGDSRWLNAILTDLETHPSLVGRLRLVANDLCFVRNGRLLVPAHHTDGDTPAEATLRLTPALKAILGLTRTPAPADTLIEQVSQIYPDIPHAMIESTLAALIAHRVLLTPLRAPMRTVDGLGHLIDELDVAGAESVGDLQPVVSGLREVYKTFTEHDNAPVATRPAVRHTLNRLMADVEPGPSAQRLAVDLRLDASVTLPAVVTGRAATGAELLTRLSVHPEGHDAWRDYHLRFLDRYGPDAAVPVRQLLDPNLGIGLPAGFTDSSRSAPPHTYTARDQKLAALVQRAVFHGDVEIVLDTETINDLSADIDRPPAHIEIGFQIHAASASDIDQGDFDLAVTATSRAAGTTAGRFLYLLPDRDRFAAALAALPAASPGAVVVQVSSPPLFVSTGNVAHDYPVTRHVVHVGEPPEPGGSALGLDDLSVTGDAHGMYLESASLGRRVEATAFNAVDFQHRTQPIARFLSEVTRATASVCWSALWGENRTLPFLPRLRHGRIILSPAQWRITRTELTDRFSAVRERMRIPAAVYLSNGDQHLPLDLDDAAHLRLLHRAAERTGYIDLTESPPLSAFGWSDGRPHEINLPLAATARSDTGPAVCRARIEPSTGHLPGDNQWLYAKLYVHQDHHTDVLTRTAALLGYQTWWFVPYLDPEPHLRVRVGLSADNTFATTATALHDLTRDLRDAGLTTRVSLDTYIPEVGRYGTGPTMEAAEAVFCADSTAALAQRVDAPGAAATTASLVDIAVSFLGDRDTAMRWIVARVVAKTSTPLDRTVLRRAAGFEPAPDVAAVWQLRRDRLADYRSRVDAARVDDVLAALLHMHYVRASGVDHQAEHDLHKLIRAVALASTARKENRHGD